MTQRCDSLGKRQATTLELRGPGPSQTATDDSPQAWLQFVDDYERLTAVICAAAHLGCSPVYEGEFQQVRLRLAHLCGPIAHRLAEVGVRARVDDNKTVAQGPFERLIQTQHLRDLLEDDSGELIPNLADLSERIYSVSV